MSTSKAPPVGRAGDLEDPLSEGSIAVLRGRLLGLVRRSCPSWLADQAEDIVQATLARVLERRAGGENQSVSSSYIMKAAHNAVIDEVRRRFRRAPVMQGGDEGLSSAPAGNPHPEQLAEAAEIDRAIRACLGGLETPRRHAVTLHLLGHSLKECCEALGGTYKRTEHLVYRGLEDLRRCLTKKGLQP